METEATRESQMLAPQLAELRAKLDGLVTELRATDAELAALATEREQHRLLADACGALDRLHDTGGASLFWGDRSAAASDEQLRRARGRAEAFQKRVGGIEE